MGLRELFSREVWHYTCKNGHKWENKQSPRGTYLFGESGQTKCPICKSSICRGEVYINGKITSAGAVHVDFQEEKRRKRK